MAERWQQWMPFHIDRFRGSPAVQAMHPAARIGYLYLLASAWQTDDCTLSTDPLDLAEASGLGDELWAIYGARILRMFQPCGEGRITNSVLKVEWDEALAIYQRGQQQREWVAAARSEAGKKGNAKRWQKDRNCDKDSSQSTTFATNDDRKPIASDRLTGTETLTGTVKTKTLAYTANAVPADKGKLLGTLPLNDGSEWEVYSVYVESLVPLYSAVDVHQELRSMKGWLIGNPKLRKTRGGIKRFISAWLEKEQDKARPGGLGNGANHRVPESKWEAARKRILEEPEMDQGEADDDGRATRGPDTLAGRPDGLSVSAEWLF